MAHEYSVLVHNWISEKVKKTTQDLKKSQEEKDDLQKKFHRGQLEELDDLRKYLTDKIDLDTHKYYPK